MSDAPQSPAAWRYRFGTGPWLNDNWCVTTVKALIDGLDPTLWTVEPLGPLATPCDTCCGKLQEVATELTLVRDEVVQLRAQRDDLTRALRSYTNTYADPPYLDVIEGFMAHGMALVRALKETTKAKKETPNE
jgi:hypothetical protein